MPQFKVSRSIFHNQIAIVDALDEEAAFAFAVANEGTLEWNGDAAGTTIDPDNIEAI